MKPWINLQRVKAARDSEVLRLIALQPRVASQDRARLGRPVPVPGERCAWCGHAIAPGGRL